MYSPRSAHEEGRRLGHRLENIWLSDEELASVVRQHILPMAQPRSGARQRDADSAHGTAVAAWTIAWLAVIMIGVVHFFGGATWMSAFVSWLDPLWTWPITAALFLLAILASIHSRHKDKRARAERRKLREQLVRAAYGGAGDVIGARRQRELRTQASRGTPSSGTTTPASTSGRVPALGTGLTPRQAEELAARWMRSMGAQDVAVTQFRGDGGIDVTSARHIAQVKHLSSNVGVAPIRELAGVVRVDGRRGLFFSTSGYASGAVEFARQCGIGLFRMDVVTGQLSPMNDVAVALQKHGLG